MKSTRQPHGSQVRTQAKASSPGHTDRASELVFLNRSPDRRRPRKVVFQKGSCLGRAPALKESGTAPVHLNGRPC